MDDLKEIKHLRRPREKHFLKKDGTMIAQLYSEDGKFIQSTKDSLGRTTLYDIDPDTGLIKSMTDRKRVTTTKFIKNVRF